MTETARSRARDCSELLVTARFSGPGVVVRRGLAVTRRSSSFVVHRRSSSRFGKFSKTPRMHRVFLLKLTGLLLPFWDLPHSSAQSRKTPARAGDYRPVYPKVPRRPKDVVHVRAAGWSKWRHVPPLVIAKAGKHRGFWINLLKYTKNAQRRRACARRRLRALAARAARASTFREVAQIARACARRRLGGPGRTCAQGRLQRAGSSLSTGRLCRPSWLWTLGSGLWILDSDPGPGLWTLVPGLGSWIWDSGFWDSGILDGFWILGFWILGFWTDSGFWTLDSGFCI